MKNPKQPPHIFLRSIQIINIIYIHIYLKLLKRLHFTLLGTQFDFKESKVMNIYNTNLCLFCFCLSSIQFLRWKHYLQITHIISICKNYQQRWLFYYISFIFSSNYNLFSQPLYQVRQRLFLLIYRYIYIG